MEETEDGAPKCAKCDKPALGAGDLCEEHEDELLVERTAPPDPNAPKPSRLGRWLVVLLCVLAIWAFPKVGFLRRLLPGGSEPTPAPQAAGATPATSGGAARQTQASPKAGRSAPRDVSLGGPMPGDASASKCGNGVVEPGEECDGAALAGASCARLGFRGDCGTDEACVRAGLACLPNCSFDYTGCTAEVHTAVQRFVDNGDGTMVDRLTGLMWELKCTERGCSDRHDVFASKPWRSAVSEWVASLNEEAYAGHRDWRLPTAEELRTLLVAVPPCAKEPCDATVLPREQIAPAAYWTSTTFSIDKRRAWAVSFRDGEVYTADKSDALHVRAVRPRS